MLPTKSFFIVLSSLVVIRWNSHGAYWRRIAAKAEYPFWSRAVWKLEVEPPHAGFGRRRLSVHAPEFDFAGAEKFVACVRG
jgi:hypothetical protein